MSWTELQSRTAVNGARHATLVVGDPLPARKTRPRWSRPLAARAIIALLSLVAGLLVVPLSVAAQGCPTSLTFGQTVECALQSAGEVDSFTFTGAAGDAIRVRAIGTSGSLRLDPELRQPDGSAICDLASVKMTCRLQNTGTHTIIVSGSSRANGTGFYSLYLQRLNNPQNCTPLAFGGAPLAGGLAIPGEMDCFTISGSLNDQVRLHLQPVSGSLSGITQEVVAPDGTTECDSAANVNDLTCRLHATGQHTVLVAISTASVMVGTGSYTVYAQRLTNPVGCTLAAFGGGPLAGAISAAGEVDCFTFTGAASDQIVVWAPASEGLPTAALEIIGPAGASICGPAPFFGGSGGATGQITCRLEASGLHTVLLIGVSSTAYPSYYGYPPNGPATGTYSIYAQRLNNPVGCTTLSYSGTPATGTIGAPGEMDCFTFAGTPGERVRARVLATSAVLYAWLFVVKPDGTTCSTSPYQGNFPALPGFAYGGDSEATCTLDASGTHSVFVSMRFSSYLGSGTGQFSLLLQRISPPSGCQALGYGGLPVAASINSNVELDCYTFAGTGGDRMRVDFTAVQPFTFARLEVWQPNGAPLCNFYYSPAPTDTSCQLEATGTHIILVSESVGRNTWSYQIGVRCQSGSCPGAGGGGLTIADGGRLTWSPGTLQTGYMIRRSSFPSGATNNVGPLSDSATSYQDPTGLGTDSIRCYVLSPIVASGQAISSDFLCWMPAPTSPSSPRSFGLQLSGATAALSWNHPTGAYDGYQLVAVDLTTSSIRVATVSSLATNVAQATGGKPTCYVLLAMQGPNVAGTTAVLCAFPGTGTAAASSSAANSAPPSAAPMLREALPRIAPTLRRD